MIGSVDAPQDIYVSRGADRVGEPEIDEAEAVRWVPIREDQEAAGSDALYALTVEKVSVDTYWA